MAPPAAGTVAASVPRQRRPWPVHLLRPVSWGRFWFVWCPTEGAPRARHETVEGARGEARRLAAAHPGCEFVVLMATMQGAPECVRLPALEGAASTQQAPPPALYSPAQDGADLELPELPDGSTVAGPGREGTSP